jgi:hypothetical protein
MEGRRKNKGEKMMKRVGAYDWFCCRDLIN